MARSDATVASVCSYMMPPDGGLSGLHCLRQVSAIRGGCCEDEDYHSSQIAQREFNMTQELDAPTYTMMTEHSAHTQSHIHTFDVTIMLFPIDHWCCKLVQVCVCVCMANQHQTRQAGDTMH